MKYKKQNTPNFRKRQFRLVFLCMSIIIIPLFTVIRNQDNTNAFIPDGFHAATSSMIISKQSDILDESTRDVEVGETEQEFTLVHMATFDTLDYAFGVYVKNGVAYIADQHQDLLIVDVSNPRYPTFVSQGEFASSTRYGIEVKDNYCYVAGWNNRLPIFDVSNINSPELVYSLYDYPSDAHDFVIQNDLIYIADYIHGMYIYNISTPTSPTFVGSYDISYQVQDIEIVDDYAYLAAMDGLLILNISDVTNPSYINLYSTSEPIDGLVIKDNCAYIAGGTQGLLILNITNPLGPSLLSSYNTPGLAARVQLRLNHAFVCDLEGGLQIINVTDIANPTITYELTNYTEARNIFFEGNYVYLANGHSGLEIFYIATYTKTSKISIIGDSNLDIFPNKTGSGTVEDPYIIAYYVIDAGGVDSAISLSGIGGSVNERHLILENIIVLNAGNDLDGRDAGIELDHCRYIKIRNCNVFNNSWGIALDNSEDCEISSSFISENNRSGINSFIENTNITIKNNYFDKNDNGINFDGGTNSVISDNTFNNNHIAVKLDVINHVTIEHNNFLLKERQISWKKLGAVEVTECSYISIQDNSITRVGSTEPDYGIKLSISENIEVSSNTIDRSTIGIWLENSDTNALSENSISNCEEGIYLVTSNDNEILRNEFDGNPIDYQVGIELFDSDNNEVSENTITQSNVGIRLEESDYNTLSNNFISNCEEGIYLVTSNDNEILRNKFDGNPLVCQVGIELFDSDNNEVSENTITQSNIGIRLEESDYNTLSNNFMSNCEEGIYLVTSNNNEILRNEFDGNTHDYLEENSSGNVFKPYINITKLILWITLSMIFIPSIILSSIYLPKLYKKRAPIRDAKRLEQENLLREQQLQFGMICTQCNRIMPYRNLEICVFCGKPLQKPIQKPSTRQIQIEKPFCIHCGKMMPELDLDFCIYCGEKLEKSEAKGVEDTPETKEIPQMKMICPHCGKKVLDPNLRFCLFCGKSL